MCLCAVLATALWMPTSRAAAQAEGELAARGPRFLLASREGDRRPVPVDVSKTPLLQQRLSLDLASVPIKQALSIVARQSGLELVYSDDFLPADARVTLRADGIALAAALTNILIDANVDVVFARDGRASLARRAGSEAVPAVGTLSGRVTDAVSGQPIPLVQVSVAGTSLGRSTDDNGRYVIVGVPAGDYLVHARRIGYEPSSRRVTVMDGDIATADFALVRAATSLDAIVVMVTGAQRRVELGHTVGIINADSLVREAPVTNLTDLLTARVPGVIVNFQSGLTGVTPPIRIRGLNSFTMGNDPLILIDGIRVEATSSTFLFDQFGVKSSRLGDFNPDEIESVEVVKGPSAATLYGTDAANGVIVIRTKRGVAGPTRWTTYAEGGIIARPATNFPTNYYGFGRLTTTGAQVACTLALQASKSCMLDSLRSFNPVDNPDLTPLGRGDRVQFGTQVSGGAGAFRYFAAGEIERELGFIKMSESDQRLVSAQRGGAEIPYEQIRPNASRKVSLRGNVTANLGERSDLTFSNSLMLGAFRTPNSGTVYQGTVFSAGARTGVLATPTAIANGFQRRNADDVTRYINSIGYNWRPFDWLTTRSTAGLDFSLASSDQLVKAGEGGSATGSRLLTQNGIGQFTIDLGATAARSFTDAITSKTSVGVQYNRRRQSVTATSATGLAPGSETVTGAATVTGSESKADAVVAGAYIDQQVGWKERLFATLSVRADGSSTFGRNLRTTAYPKAGLSWLVSKEPAIPTIPGIESLRLRAAYGASGVQPPSTAAIATVALSNAVISGISVNAVTDGSPGNPDVRPERSTELEAGLDFEAVGGRVKTEFTWYTRKSTDALLSLAFPVSAGGGSRFVNIGSVTNRGLELLVNLNVIERRAFGFNLTVNGSTNTNKLVSRDPASDLLPANPNVFASTIVTGYPLYGLWQRPLLGYTDTDGDGFIEPGEVTIGATAVYVGPATPTKQLSVIPSMSFLDGMVHTNALFDWRGGYSRMHFGEFGRCTILLVCREDFDPETPLEDQAKIIAYNTTTSTYGYIYDGTFLKLRELSVTLRAPDRLARALRSTGASLTLSGRNLALWTNYPEDPEVNGSLGSEFIQTQNTMPAGRYWIARFNLSH